LFDKSNLKDFLLTKIVNGYIKARHCPPMNRLYYVPRGDTLNELCAKFPPETKKEVEARERRELMERIQLRQSYNTLDNVTKKVLIVKSMQSVQHYHLPFSSHSRA
jgi:hypothetical protein